MSTFQTVKPAQVAYKLHNGINAEGSQNKLTNANFDLKDAQHIQGMGTYDNFIILAYSCESGVSTPGHLLIFDKTSGAMIRSITLTEGQRHPAGMQTIGDYLFVAIGNKEEQYVIALYNLLPLKTGQTPTLQASLTTDKIARCVGITDISETGITKYILVVPEHEGDEQKSHFYKSRFSDIASVRNGSLEDKNGQFEYCGCAKANFAENCGLVTQNDGKVFLVGFRSDGNDFMSYKDYIETYEVSFNPIKLGEKQPQHESKKVSSSLGNNGEDIHFRWGACLEIGSDQRLTCYATERSRHNDGTIKYDTFKPGEILWIDTQKLTTGQEISVSINNKKNYVEVHRGSGGSDLHYSVGTINFNDGTIDYKGSPQYSTGQTPSITMDDNGNCIEVHRGYSKDNSKNLYYRVSKVNITTGEVFKDDDYTWHHYTEGYEPSIAMDNSGHCIVVHRGYDDDKTLFYGVGTVKNGKIDFHNDGKFHSYTTGQTPSVSLDDNGNCIVVHRGKDDSKNLCYGVGKVKNFKDGTIDFHNDGPDDFDSYTTGQTPSIALDNDGNYIEMHRGSGSSKSLYYRVGKVNFNAGTIDGHDTQYTTGQTPSIALVVFDGSLHCIEMHRGSDNSENLDYAVSSVILVR